MPPPRMPTAPISPVARAFLDPRGRRWVVDGVSVLTGSVHLVCGLEDRYLASEQLCETVAREKWTAEAELPASSRRGSGA
jgi:hypothetical protein